MRKLFLLLVSAAILFAFAAHAGTPRQDPEVEPITVGANDWPWWRGPQRNGVADASAEAAAQVERDGECAVEDADSRSRPRFAHRRRRSDFPGDRRPQGVDAIGALLTTARPALALAERNPSGRFPKGGNAKCSFASSTLACDGKRVFINFLHDNAIYATALTRDGKQLWQTKITDYSLHQGFASSPAVYQNRW